MQLIKASDKNKSNLKIGVGVYEKYFEFDV